jgi:CheY-like chemotaxis protein
MGHQGLPAIGVRNAEKIGMEAAMKRNETFQLFLLEDDDNDAYMIQRAIERTGVPCELTRFHEPRAAIDKLLHFPKPEAHAPHLILTDLKMPGMSGLEFVKWLRSSRFACIPVIMLSGSSLPEDILAAYRQGANSFSTKPMSVTNLEEIVNTVLKYWKEACQTPTSVLRDGMDLCGTQNGKEPGE